MSVDVVSSPVIESLPVLPMPSIVLFPGIVVPLEIVEERYRQMVADLLEGDGYLALAMIKPGTEQHEHPELFEVAGAGKIIHSEKVLGGQRNILVEGLHRVRLLNELPPERPYRRFRAAMIPRPTDADTNKAQEELLRLESCVVSLISSIAETDAELVEVVRSTPDPVKLADILSATVVPDAVRQQELLAAGDLKVRLAKLVDAMVDVLVEVNKPPNSAQLN